MMKRFHFVTVGCQMNVLDSELAAAELICAGYQPTDNPKEADIILFNTCSVREHAEEKIYSALGRLKHWKEYHPDGIIGVLGCMAQKDREIVFRRAPHVDLVLGPGQLDRLPDLIQAIFTHRLPQIAVSLDRFGHKDNVQTIRESFRQYDPIRLAETRSSRFQAMVRIMFGCNQFCSYCIVPQVRGPEQSRPATDIVREIKTLADQGCLEVTLLGQTVNSYRYREGERILDLADLLERINDVSGIERIRFVSNYPTGMTNKLLTAVRDLPKVLPFLHVPAQHGADSVLERMRRHYTVGEYRDLIDRIHEIIPDASVTSDFIVGFCGETEDEFQQLVDLVRYCRFKNSFIFKYSPRKGTYSAENLADDVPEAVKKRRNNELLAVQNEICSEQNQSFLGKRVRILVEGESKNAKKEAENQKKSSLISFDSEENDVSSLPMVTSQSPSSDQIQLTGRTPCDRIVVFDGSPSLVGTFQELTIEGATPFTLLGRLS